MKNGPKKKLFDHVHTKLSKQTLNRDALNGISAIPD
jgi:hypothetical protein